MDDAAFATLVEEGIESLPEHVRAKMHNVAIVIADDLTDADRLEHGFDPHDALFGLYEGIPQTERGVDYAALPDKITIFKLPILAAYTDPEDIRACVANTVWHEVAHHFGFGEEWVEREERRRGKTR